MISHRQSLVNDVLIAVAAALGYFAMCWLGLSLDVTAGVSSVWPASGLLTGLLLVVRRNHWRSIATGALIGGVAANLSIGFSPILSVGYTLINLAESFTATLLVRRFAPDAVRLRQPADVLSFSALSVAAATVGALLAATLAAGVSDAKFWVVLRTSVASLRWGPSSWLSRGAATARRRGRFAGQLNAR
jgi:integral membrane sensor domain MASE1